MLLLGRGRHLPASMYLVEGSSKPSTLHREDHARGRRRNAGSIPMTWPVSHPSIPPAQTGV